MTVPNYSNICPGQETPSTRSGLKADSPAAIAAIALPARSACPDWAGAGLLGGRVPVLPATLFEDRAAAFHKDESADVVVICRVGRTPSRSGLLTANGH
jgi:hypothetical protein